MACHRRAARGGIRDTRVYALRSLLRVSALLAERSKRDDTEDDSNDDPNSSREIIAGLEGLLLDRLARIRRHCGRGGDDLTIKLWYLCTAEAALLCRPLDHFRANWAGHLV